jgi:spoIIIJ-associated protein
MTSVEIQAYSVDEAVRLALEQLGLGEQDVDIEILSDAGPDEGDEALVRVTAKGMASQPGDRPSSRGTPPRERSRAPVTERVRDVDRVDEAEEKVAKEIVRELLAHMGIAADVVAVDNPSTMALDAEDPPTIFIEILGQDLGMLIGRRGDHLSQLQYLVNLIANRRLESWTRVVVDVEGYRTRREESLIGLAERIGRQVARSRRPIILEPMPPNERRIVHLTLRGNPDVTTESSGEGSMRRVTVQPRA